MPERKLISLDEFRTEARAGRKPESAIFRISVDVPQPAGDGSRRIRFCFSDGSIDRAGDTIDPQGWDTTAFLRNPVTLWAHDSWSPPIGRASNLAIERQGLMGDIEFAPPEIYAFADTVFRLVRAKYINACSVGFMPIEWSFVDDKDRGFGMDFKRQELLEISIVPVPCNANALSEARAKGIDTRPVLEWAERMLDGGGRILVPRSLLEKTFKAARTPPAIRKQYLKAEAPASDWKVGAARDLPIDESDTWDGGSAKASIFAHAGGDDFDPAIARKGFLFYDAGKPKERGSYKEPFAHVVDGVMKAAPGGIRAAAQRLSSTDVPEAVKTTAREVLDHYEAKMADNKISLTALQALIAAELKRIGIKTPSGSGEGSPSGGGAGVDDHDGDEPTHEEALRAAHVHVKMAGALHKAAGELHKNAIGLLKKAVDHFDNPEGEKAAGSAEECVRSAHSTLKAAADLSSEGNDHHQKAVDMLQKAIDSIGNPEAEGGGKSALITRLRAAKKRHENDGSAEAAD